MILDYEFSCRTQGWPGPKGAEFHNALRPLLTLLFLVLSIAACRGVSIDAADSGIQTSCGSVPSLYGVDGALLPGEASCTQSSMAPFFTTYPAKTQSAARYALRLDNGFIVGGMVFFPEMPLAHGFSDARVVRIDAKGELLWDHTFGGGGNDFVAGLVADLNGDVVVAGTTGPPGSPTETASLLQSEIWLFKVGGSGDLVWSKTYGGAVLRAGAGIVAAASGFVVAASSQATADSAAGGDVVLLGIGNDGEQVWSSASDNLSKGEAAALVAAGSGYAIVGDGFNGNGYDVDAFLLFSDATGDFLWRRDYGGSQSDKATSVVALPDGFAILGWTMSPEIIGGAPPIDGTALWLFRTDVSGMKLWSHVYGQAGSRYSTELVGTVASIASVDDGFAVLGGSASGHNDDPNVMRIGIGGEFQSRLKFGVYGEAGSTILGMPGGSLVVGWAIDLNFAVWRLDNFANKTCHISGLCVGQPISLCDDSNPCTNDGCNAPYCGCWHQATADGAPCGNAKTCHGGTCQ